MSCCTFKDRDTKFSLNEVTVCVGLGGGGGVGWDRKWVLLCRTRSNNMVSGRADHTWTQYVAVAKGNKLRLCPEQLEAQGACVSAHCDIDISLDLRETSYGCSCVLTGKLNIPSCTFHPVAPSRKGNPKATCIAQEKHSMMSRMNLACGQTLCS